MIEVVADNDDVELSLPLSEVFGPTFQGEGPHAGRCCVFVRLGRCNLSCEWCDTPYTWDHTRYDVRAECPDMAIGSILDDVDDRYAHLVVVSGGEPLLHARKLRELFSPLWEWHVETNGTIAPPEWWTEYVTHTSVSPKINTRDPEAKRLRPRALEVWADLAKRGWACWKFVVTNADELATVADLAQTYDVPGDKVWVMPEGTTAPVILERQRLLAKPVLAYGFNMSTRLHTLLWDDERGH